MPLEPSQIEIFITRLVGNIFPGFYREYVFHLPIEGHEHLLDYGSGSGICAKFLAKRLSRNGHLTCVDISCRWQNEIQKRLGKYTNVSFGLGDLETFNFPLCSFDCIFIHFVLHDIPQPQLKNRIATLTNLLKPGGYIFVREPENLQHGIAAQTLRDQFIGLPLSEISFTREKHFFAGNLFQVIYRK